MHGIFVDPNRMKNLRSMAMFFLGAEILGSAGILYHNQSQNVSVSLTVGMLTIDIFCGTGQDVDSEQHL